MKKRDCTSYVVKTKALIRCALTAQLILAFVFAYAKSWFSHDAAHIIQVLICFQSQVTAEKVKTHTHSRNSSNSKSSFPIEESNMEVFKTEGEAQRFNHLPKIQTKRPNLLVFCQNDACGIANSEDLDHCTWVCTVCPDMSVRKLRIITEII